MTATLGHYVQLEYTFTDSKGRLLGSSAHSGLYIFKIGAGDAIPGLEENIIGLTPSDETTFVIPAEKAYGVRDESLSVSVPRNYFPSETVIAMGNNVAVNHKILTIVDYNDTNIFLDGNHPLAGIDLHFSVRVHSVSETEPGEYGGCECSSSCGCH